MSRHVVGDERLAIRTCWPEHAEHLNADPNAVMGIGETDDERGIICNCGAVLGWPPAPGQPDGAEQSEPADGADFEPPWDPHEELEPPGPQDPNTWDELNTWTPLGDVPIPPDEPDPHNLAAWVDPQDREPDAEQAGAVAAYAGPPAAQPSAVEASDPLAAAVPIIDPTRPYTPMEVEHQLLDIGGRIERGLAFYAEWERELYEAQMAYDLAAARATVASKASSVDRRKADVVLRCENELARLRTAETMVKVTREVMHNLRALQSGFQTVSRSVADALRGPNIRP